MSATAETASTGPLTTGPHLNMLLHSVLSLQFNTGVSWRKGVSHTVMMVIPLFLMLFDSLLGFSLCNSLVYTYTTVIIYVYIYYHASCSKAENTEKVDKKAVFGFVLAL